MPHSSTRVILSTLFAGVRWNLSSWRCQCGSFNFCGEIFCMCAFNRCPSLLQAWFVLGHFPKNLHPHLNLASISNIPNVDGQLAVTPFFDTMLCKPTQGRSCWCVKNASDSLLPPAQRFPASQTCWPAVSNSWEIKKMICYWWERKKKRSGGLHLVFRTEVFRSTLLAWWANS